MGPETSSFLWILLAGPARGRVGQGYGRLTAIALSFCFSARIGKRQHTGKQRRYAIFFLMLLMPGSCAALTAHASDTRGQDAPRDVATSLHIFYCLSFWHFWRQFILRQRSLRMRAIFIPGDFVSSFSKVIPCRDFNKNFPAGHGPN